MNLMKSLRAEIKKDINESLAMANAEPELEVTLSEELNDIYKTFVFEEVRSSEVKENTLYRRYFTSLKQSMERHDNLLLWDKTLPNMVVLLKSLMDL
jgi:2-oxoisovalerate dehydrogenase E1 component